MCCNAKQRYALGVAIGAIYILLSVIVFIVSVSFYLNSKVEGGEYRERFPTFVVVSSWVAGLISALFIYAILKKYPYLMVPWFLLCVAGFIYSCFGIFILYFAAAWGNARNEVFLLILIIGACLIGFEVAVFWFSCCLYGEIRKFNKENSNRLEVRYQKESKNNYAHI